MIATVDADEPLCGPEMGLETLNLCWWNTRLAPPCTSRKAKTAPKSRFAKAVEVIAALARIGLDVVGLGEVDEQVVEQLQSEFAGRGLDGFDWIGPERGFVGKDRHLSVLCRRRKLAVEHVWLGDNYKGRGWNSALSLRARSPSMIPPCKSSSSHWPSTGGRRARIFKAPSPTNSGKRSTRFKQGRRRNQSCSWATSTRNHLIRASMRRCAVSAHAAPSFQAVDGYTTRSGDGLANPRRWTRRATNNIRQEPTDGAQGKMPSGRQSDQILVSHGLLDGCLRLRETATGILYPRTILRPDGGFTDGFDHLPVFAVLEHHRRKEPND